jgi:asparagine synthase (glutamine-hydrolysing)
VSIQFGRWDFDGAPPDRAYFEKVLALLAPYGSDRVSFDRDDAVGMLHLAFPTNRESRSERQPHRLRSGAILTLDGQLDNRSELLRQFANLVPDVPDVTIVAESYARWGPGCFPKLLGDWAVAIWLASTRSLLLARDFLGSRPLYYSVDDKRATWSSVLDPLVLLAEESLILDTDYVARWISSFPRANCTPYRGISSVPPASFVEIRHEGAKTVQFWDFVPRRTLSCRTDSEYEERFRTFFREAVRRKLRSDSPVLAELSGGMDSSSIICMADAILEERGTDETPRLDTVSYYDDLEPHWDERPYFAKVEEKRGRAGCHISAPSARKGSLQSFGDRIPLLPGKTVSADARAQFIECLRSNGNRVLLSGIGGDEVFGGVPTPIPELADLVASGRFLEFARKITAWALATRRPLLHLAVRTATATCYWKSFGPNGYPNSIPWLRRDHAADTPNTSPKSELSLLRLRPSFRANLAALDALRNQLACTVPPRQPGYETRYPCLDRDLLEFLYALPREQLVRPGQRRSLQRRALRSIVPEELLQRKRKAFVSRGPSLTLAAYASDRRGTTEPLFVEMLGIVDALKFTQNLEALAHGRQAPVIPLLRTIEIEFWLRQIAETNFIRIPAGSNLRTTAKAAAAKQKEVTA